MLLIRPKWREQQFTFHKLFVTLRSIATPCAQSFLFRISIRNTTFEITAHALDLHFRFRSSNEKNKATFVEKHTTN